jgi:hypothetical protein
MSREVMTDLRTLPECPLEPSGEDAGDGLAIELLPYVVGRRAGVPHRRLADLGSIRTVALLDQQQALEASCRRLAPSACASLELLIATATGDDRRRLIGLKRDIYNDRLSSTDDMSRAREYLVANAAGDRAAAVQRWLDVRDTRARLQLQAESMSARELFETRARLKRVLRKPAFRDGLALASVSLNHELQHYLQTDGPHALPRFARIERALLRYYTRCALKLTPFSTFTRYFLAHVDRDDTALCRANRRSPRVGRSANVNRALIRHVATSLVAHPEYGRWVPVRMTNNILTREDKTYVLRHQYSRPRMTPMLVPHEDAVALVAKPELLGLVASILARTGGTAPRQQLETALAAVIGDSASARAAIDRLTALGVIVQRIPLPQDESDGIEALASFLDHTGICALGRIAASLRSLGQSVGQLRSGDHRSRAAVLERIDGTVQAILAGVKNDGATWHGDLVYENCVEQPVGALRIGEEWAGAVSDLRSFIRCYGWFLDPNPAFRDEVRSALLTVFDGRPTPLLEFLHRFTTIRTPRSEPVRRLEALRSQVAASLAEASTDVCQDLRILAEDLHLRQAPAHLRWLGRREVFSLACHCQPLLGSDGERALWIDAVHGGCARHLLRVCQMLAAPDRTMVVNRLRQWFASAWHPAEPCELRATFDFNGNLHPEVTDRVIDYCDEDNRRRRGVALSSLWLQLTEDGEPVVVDGESRTSVVPLDISALASVFAPMSYSLLSALGHCNILGGRIFHPYTWRTLEDGGGSCGQFPRLVFGACVLRRQGWWLSNKELPRRERQETDFSYFAKVRRWQTARGLPDEVFIHRLGEGGALPRSSDSRKVWVRHKPQYINFTAQLFMPVVEDILADAAQVYVEEMLPDRGNWQRAACHRPVEYVAEFWIRGGAAAAPGLAQ